MIQCDYAVIGGGISGLVAAHILRRAKRDVLLVSPSADLGGCIRSRNQDGYTLELGANTFSMNPEFEALLHDLELSAQVRTPAISPFKQYVWHAGQPHEVPRGPFALLRSPLFSPYEKARLVWGLTKKLRVQDAPSVAEAFTELLGPAPVHRALDPALRGIFGGDLTRLQLNHVFPTVGEHLLRGGTILGYMKNLKKGRTVFCLEGGNGALIARLHDSLQGVHLDGSVTQLTRTSDARFELNLSSGETIFASNVCIATSGSATASFIRGLQPLLALQLEALPYAPVTVIHCEVSPSSPLPPAGFGILFPSSAPSKLMGVLFNSVLFPHVAPVGSGLITVCVGGVNQQEVATLDDRLLTKLVGEELSMHLGITPRSVLSIHRWARAIPQYEGGFSALRDMQRQTEENFPGLFFIGVDTGGIGVPERVRRVSSQMGPFGGVDTFAQIPGEGHKG